MDGCCQPGHLCRHKLCDSERSRWEGGGGWEATAETMLPGLCGVQEPPVGWLVDLIHNLPFIAPN